ncbi:MAG TPA: class I SAM-dependent methyltransferase [Ktedonobacterales bacterium]|nr:class I SAM-dependent methyltransferase [Ktedonobacterales bacterium]
MTGWLWLSHQDRIPAKRDVKLTDVSLGMIEEAQHNRAHVSHAFNSAVTDAQKLSYSDNEYDAVIANHMLYHTSDTCLTCLPLSQRFVV